MITHKDGGFIMQNSFMKIGLLTGLSSFVLLIIGMRNILGEQIEIVNFIAFTIIGLILGLSSASLLFYKAHIAFTIFIIAVALAFFEMFRNYITNPHGMGADIGILSLFIIASFGLGLALIIEFIVRLVKKQKTDA